MDTSLIAKLINDECGLVVETKTRSLEAAIQTRMDDLGTDSINQFYNTLRKSQDEIHRLADLLTINETYFFREKQHLDLFTDSLISEMLSKKYAPVKVLSAGCASGEEPYSLAISLSEKYGVEILALITILGCDIDQNAIRRAREGIYNKYSFRKTDPSMIKKYFIPTHDRRYKLSDSIKDKLKFYRLNLLDNNYPDALREVDIIFYRNVSIYFDKNSQKLVFSKLANLLKQGGYIFMGSAETYTHNYDILSLVKMNGVFLFHKKKESELAGKGTYHRRSATVSSDKTQSDRSDQKRSSRYDRPTTQQTSIQLQDSQKDAVTVHDLFKTALSKAKVKKYEEALDCIDIQIQQAPYFIQAYCLKASILITLQCIDEAKEVCMDALKKDEWNSECFLLLGLIAKIEGNSTQAIKRFKEAIYNQPSLWLAHFYLGELYADRNEVERSIREYDLTIKLLKNRESATLDITYFPLSFSEEHLIHLCKYKRTQLSQ